MVRFSINLRVLLVVVLISSLLWTQPALAMSGVRAEVIDLIEQYYPGKIDPGIYKIRSAPEIVAALNDPFSIYLEQSEYDSFMAELDGSFCGIGIYMDTAPQGILVTDILPASPAEAAGLKVGDLVKRIDYVSVQGLTLDQVQTKLQGKENTRVAMTIVRGEEQFDLTLKRAYMAIPSVRGQKLDNGIAYLQVRSFSSNTASEMEHYITTLDPDCDQWILDLRGNSGGYILTAAELAGFLMDVNNMMVLEQKEERFQLPVWPQAKMIDEMMIVLLDGSTASASELLAAALKDYQRALLVGETSFGKGTMQEMFNLENGDVLKLTVAEFYSPQGHKIHQVGVAPDVEVASEQALEAAWLLLSQPVGGCSRAYIEVGAGKFVVDLEVARRDDYWEAWNSLTDELNILQVEYGCGGTENAVELSRYDIKRHWPVYYPDYRLLGEYYQLDMDEPLILSIDGLNQKGPHGSDGLELIDSQSGERISFETEQLGNLLRLRPLEVLAGHEYWLLWHGRTNAGADASPPAIAVLHYREMTSN